MDPGKTKRANLSGDPTTLERFEAFLGDQSFIDILLKFEPQRIQLQSRRNLRSLSEHFCQGLDDDPDSSMIWSPKPTSPPPRMTTRGASRTGRSQRPSTIPAKRKTGPATRGLFRPFPLRGPTTRTGATGTRASSAPAQPSIAGSSRQHAVTNSEVTDIPDGNPSTSRVNHMMRLTKDLSVSQALLDLLEERGANISAEDVFDEVAPLTVYGVMTAQGQGGYGAKLMAQIEYDDSIGERGELDPVRQAFQRLCIFDLVTLMFPNHSGRRFSEEMRARFREILQEHLVNEKDIEEAVDKIDIRSRMGLKIGQLCERFSNGCLFFLAKTLSQDFLNNKYRESGEFHDAAFAELERQNLRDLVVEAGLGGLGNMCRADLIGQYGGLLGE